MDCFKVCLQLTPKDVPAGRPPAEGKPVEDWTKEEVAGWYSTLVPDMQKFRAVLLPEEGCVVVKWNEQYLKGKKVPEADAMRLLAYRDKAVARADKAAAAVAAAAAAAAAGAVAAAPVAAAATSPSSAPAAPAAKVGTHPASAPVVDVTATTATSPHQAVVPAQQQPQVQPSSAAPGSAAAAPAIGTPVPYLAGTGSGVGAGAAASETTTVVAMVGEQGTEEEGAACIVEEETTTTTTTGSEESKVSLMAVVSKGITVAKVVIEKVGSNLPFPGSEAASLVLTLLELVEKAIANAENLKGLRDRAVAVLDILTAYHPELIRVRKYKGVVESYKEVLEGINAYARAYTERNCLMRLLTANSDESHFEELVDEMSELNERVMLALSTDTNARLQHVQAAVEEARQLLRAQAKYQDPAAGARALVAEMGGLEVVLADEGKLQQVVKTLDVSSQVTIQVMSSLMESYLDKGPQRHISHPDLRLFWKRLYAGEVEVPWFVFWSDFPDKLRENPMDEEAVAELRQLVSDPEARALLERAVERENTKDRVSVWELKVAFNSDKGLAEQIRMIIDMAASAVLAGGDVVTGITQTPSGPSAPMKTTTTTTTWAVSKPPSTKPQPHSLMAFHQQQQPTSPPAQLSARPSWGLSGYTEGGMNATVGANTRRQLPPLVSNYVGRAEEAMEVVAHLETLGSLVLVASGGMGKSCLAADVGWRLVKAGKVPAGALWVDLRDADTVTKVETRFCAAFGLQPEKSGNGPRIVHAANKLCEHGLGVRASVMTDACRAHSAMSDDVGMAASAASASAGAQPLAVQQALRTASAAAAAAPAHHVVPMLGLVVVDNAEDALLEPMAAEALTHLTSKMHNEAPSMRMLFTTRTSYHEAIAAHPNLASMPALPEHRVGAISPAAAGQLVRVVAADLSEEEAGRVAVACHYVPLVLCLVADALVAGRLTLEDMATIAGTADTSLHSAASANDIARHIVRLVLGSLKRQHQIAAAQLAVFASAFDYEKAAAVMGLSDAQVHGVIAVLYHHSILQRSGMTNEYTMHSMVREQTLLLSRQREPQRVADAEGRFVTYMLTELREWARMYRTAKEWGLALSMARGNFANISKMIDLLRAGIAPGEEGDAFQTVKEQRDRDVRQQALQQHAQEVTTDASISGLLRGWDTLVVAEMLVQEAVMLLQDLFVLLRIGWPAKFILHDLEDRIAAATREGAAPSSLESCSAEVRRLQLGRANVLFFLARVNQLMGQLGDADREIHQCFDIRTALLGPEHPDTAAALEGVAFILNCEKKQSDAEPLFRQALDIRLRVLGPENVYTVSSYHTLAMCIDDQGRHEEAEPLFRQAMKLSHAVLGEEHSDNAFILNHLALCIQSLGQHSEAEALNQQALALRRKVLGEEHIATTLSMVCLALCVSRQGRYEEAESLFREALSLRQRVLVEEHPAILEAREQLADCLEHIPGREAEVKELREQLRQLRQRPAAHPQ